MTTAELVMKTRDDIAIAIVRLVIERHLPMEPGTPATECLDHCIQRGLIHDEIAAAREAGSLIQGDTNRGTRNARSGRKEKNRQVGKPY